MTWQELKEQVNSLDEKQLSEEVQLWGCDETITILDFAVTYEDYYFLPEEDFSVIESEIDSLYENYPHDYRTPRNELKRTHKKGFPYLYND